MQFFEDADMDFATRCVLSGVRHGMAEVGETLTAISGIDDGDADSWLATFVALGRRLRDQADRAAAMGHPFSAWNAALRSANYLYAGLWWAPATSMPDATDRLWDEHRDSWELAVDHWPTPVQRVEVPDDAATLPGLWFTSRAARGGPAPAVVLVQGLGTPISDVCMTGLDGALERGHHVLVFDGPGQGAALRDRGRSLDHTWPSVIADALAMVAARPEVDPTRISLVGVGAGALFAAAGAAASADAAASAIAPAALVLDPPVTDLGADAAASLAAAADGRARHLLTWTVTRPTGASDLAAGVERLAAHSIDAATIASIKCPTLAVTAQAAYGFRGQDAALLAALRCDHRHVELRSADGAGADNGIGASQVHDAIVYDWLDATLVPGPAPWRDLAHDDGGPT